MIPIGLRRPPKNINFFMLFHSLAFIHLHRLTVQIASCTAVSVLAQRQGSFVALILGYLVSGSLGAELMLNCGKFLLPVLEERNANLLRFLQSEELTAIRILFLLALG